MIQTLWFWAIVKRKRQLLHEDIQSVLKFDVVANCFNWKTDRIDLSGIDFILIKDY